MTRDDARSTTQGLAKALGMKRRAQLSLLEEMAEIYAQALERYEGWTNRETWCAARWLTSGDTFAGTARERAQDGPVELAAAVKDYAAGVLDAGGVGGGSVLGDLLTAALDRVDWTAVTRAVLDEEPGSPA